MAVESYRPACSSISDIKRTSRCFLLFRMGDFYELFYDDAVNAAQILEISSSPAAIKCRKLIPMAGVPYHSAQQYIDVLVESAIR